jgi:hypothetical protein
MNASNDHSEVTPDPDVSRRRQPYEKPCLKTYGAVRELTAGGSATASEGSMSGMVRP